MILKRLGITNLGPYNGRHSVDLNVSPDAPVIVIHGENERGKTSFANAIRWCLYGRAKGRAGKPLSTLTLMNQEALDARVYNMSVVLEFEHDGSTYELERHAQTERRPSSDRDLQVIPHLKIDGHLQTTETIKDKVGGILHEDISRFFLFDGEMLNEYENLLSAADHGSQIVRQSIEEILGLPALQRAARDLEELRSKTERRQLQEVKARRENERLTRDAQQKEDELTAITRDIEQTSKQGAELEGRREQLKDERAKFAEVQADARQLDQIDQDMKRTTEERDVELEKCRQLLSDAWWMPLEERITQELGKSQDAVRESQERRSQKDRLSQELAQKEATLRDGTCAACGQPISADSEATLRSRITQLHNGLAPLDSEDRSVEGDVTKMSLLRPFVMGGGNLRVLREKEAQVRSLQIQRRRLSRRAEDIQERLRQHERTEIQRVERDYDLCISQLRELSRILDIQSARERDARASLERLRQQIRGLPEANPQLAGEAVLFGALKDLFEDGVAAFRERVRREVEAEATIIHRGLTTEPEYAGLRITDQYGLILVNTAGREIQRSAGSEQIVALALIGALNRCATREGPIVMDTPFGRLDRTHRKHILRFAPTFGKQVILLVQSGELTRDEAQEYLEGKVAREYQIARDGASDRSVITSLR